MEEFTARLEFSYGWCALVMKAGDESVEMSAYRLHQSFNELVASIDNLLEHRESVSVRWGTGEVAGGYFIDLVADPGDHINIAVHEFEFGSEAIDYKSIWSAARGDLKFQARVTMQSFFQEFAEQLRKVKVLSVDQSGYMEHWGWNFPETRCQHIQEAAVRYGYHPTSTDEIRKSS